MNSRTALKMNVVFFVLLVLSTWSFTQEDRKETLRLLGEAQLASGERDKAIRSYRRLLEQDPSDMEGLMRLAELLSWEGKYEESVIIYQDILSAYPERVETMRALAEVYIWSGQLERAERLYREIIKMDPYDSGAQIALGETLSGLGRYEEALDYLEGLRAESAEAELLYARTLLYTGRHHEAGKVFKDLLADPHDDRVLLVLLGDSYAYAGRHDDAASAYKKALAAGAGTEALKALADVLSWRGHFREAAEVYGEVLEKEYTTRTHLKKARVLGWGRQYKDSLREYERILFKEHCDKIKLEMMGKDAYYGGRYREAKRLYNRLLRVDIDNVEVLFDLARIYASFQMWPEAENAYVRVLREEPGHMMAQRDLARIRARSSRVVLRSGYDYFRARSTDRQADVHRHSINNVFFIPLAERASLALEHTYAHHSFEGTRGVSENRALMALSYSAMPLWRAGAHYGLAAYDGRDVGTGQVFGGYLSYHPGDTLSLSVRHQRELLQVNSHVLKDGLYRDRFTGRMDLRLSRRWIAGADHTVAYYADDNLMNDAGMDILWALTLEPRALSVRYRYGYKEYRLKDKDYWTPKGRSVSEFSVDWRHKPVIGSFLSDEGRLLYEIRYVVSLDSGLIVGHQFFYGLNWHVTERIDVNAMASVMASSAGVYEERSFRAAVRYYF